MKQNNLSNLKKRKWNPCAHIDHPGLPYTGYAHSRNIKENWDQEHVVYVMSLDYIGYSRGRSSATFQFKNVSGCVFDMSMSGFDELIKSGKLHGQHVTGEFIQTKQGENFFIEIVTED